MICNVRVWLIPEGSHINFEHPVWVDSCLSHIFDGIGRYGLFSIILPDDTEFSQLLTESATSDMHAATRPSGHRARQSALLSSLAKHMTAFSGS